MYLAARLARLGLRAIADPRIKAKPVSVSPTSVIWVGGDRDEEALNPPRPISEQPWIIIGQSGRVYVMRDGHSGIIWIQGSGAVTEKQRDAAYTIGDIIYEETGDIIVELTPPVKKKSKSATVVDESKPVSDIDTAEDPETQSEE